MGIIIMDLLSQKSSWWWSCPWSARSSSWRWPASFLFRWLVQYLCGVRWAHTGPVHSKVGYNILLSIIMFIIIIIIIVITNIITIIIPNKVSIVVITTINTILAIKLRPMQISGSPQTFHGTPLVSRFQKTLISLITKFVKNLGNLRKFVSMNNFNVWTVRYCF